MSTPVVKKAGAVVTAGTQCPRGCGHIMSDHVEEKARQCTKCACVAQDTN